MNQEDQNHRIDPELEARVAADVLGESSDLEHDQIRGLVEKDPELAAKKEEFQRVDALLRDVAQGEFNVDDEDWKLPSKRRRAVLAVIRSETAKHTQPGNVSSTVLNPPIPKHVFWSARRVTAVLSVVVLCGAMVMTTYSFLGKAARVRTSERRTDSEQMPAAMKGRQHWYAETDSHANDFLFAEGAEFEDANVDFEAPAQPSGPRIASGFEPANRSRSALSGIRDSLAAAPQAAPQATESSPQPANPAASDLYFQYGAASDFPATPELQLPLAATAETSAERANTRGFDDSLQDAEFKAELSSPSDAALGLADTERGISSFRAETTDKWASGVEKETARGSTTWMLREPNSFSREHQESGSRRYRSDLSEFEGGYAGGPTAGDSQADDSQNGSQRSTVIKGLMKMDADGESIVALDDKSLAQGIPQSGTKQERGRGQDQSQPDSTLRGGTMLRFGINPIDSKSPGQGMQWDEHFDISDQNSDDFGASDRIMFGGAVNGDAGIIQDEAKLGQVRIAGKEVARKSNQPASSLEDLKALEEKPSESTRSESLGRLAEPAGLNETNALEEAFSTFSLHVSDVSFKLAQAALEGGTWPDAAKVRIEEFVNAFDYGDPMPGQGEKVACRVEQAIHPFLQQRNLLRVSLRTAAAGRAASTPLRLTFLLDNSGSMERYDRQQTVRRAFALLAQQLNPTDQVTLISFARQPRLLADKVSGSQSQQLTALFDALPSEGGTNIEAALKLAFEKAVEQQADGTQNRIVLLTDGAVNLGDADPERLSNLITTIRDAGIAFDAAGICADGLNDEVLEALTRNGDGRYYLLDSPESADDNFVRQIAGALRPSAKNVKVQIEFNAERVGRYKLLGFEKHRLKQEDFRNDQVDAAEMAAAEAGVAVYQVEAKPDGKGDIGSVSVRFRDLSTGQMIENRWPILYQADAPRVDQATPALRIATSAALFAAKLRGESLGEIVDLKPLSDLISGLPDRSRNAKRVQQLQRMIQQARQISGN